MSLLEAQLRKQVRYEKGSDVASGGASFHMMVVWGGEHRLRQLAHVTLLESSRASSPHRPREDGLAHPTDTAIQLLLPWFSAFQPNPTALVGPSSN
jgi:hypothetical protein